MTTLREALLEVGAWCTTYPPGGPSPLDYFFVSLAGVIVLYAGYKAVHHTLRPGESNRDHIKWQILEGEDRR